MNQLFRVLLKALIIPFYRSHAGLLLFVFFVMFGMVESGQLISYHRALIEAMYGSTLFMICVFAIWMLYSFKFLLFTVKLLVKPDYQIILNAGLLTTAKGFGLMLLVVLAAFLPVLCYSVFIHKVGLTQHYYLSSTYILLFQSSLCLLSAWVLLKFLRTQHKFSWQLPSLRLPTPKSKIGFYLSYFLAEEKIAVLLSKLFSLALLYFVKENTSTGDDFRIMGLAWLLALSSHTFLILKIRAFEDNYLSWTRALPIAVSKTYLQGFTFYTLLLFPELLLITTDIGDTLTAIDLLTLLIFSGGFMSFIHAYLLKENRNTDQYSMFLFWLFIVSFMLILSKLIAILTFVLCTLSFRMILTRFYRYEPVKD